MPDDLDKYPTLGICVGCGAEIKYTPVRMPLSRPALNPMKPGHYGIEYAPMCMVCVRGQLEALQLKVDAGEMYPTQTWDVKGEEDDSLHIVPLGTTSTQEEKPLEPEKVGLMRRIFRFIW
jgi:hypothetical protein